MDRHRPTVFTRGGKSLALDRRMADRDRDDPIAVNCGRCGKSLNVRIEDLKGKRTIDCDACEHHLPIENRLPLTRSSRVSASAHAGSMDRPESLGRHMLLDDAGNPLSARLQRVLDDLLPIFRHRFPALGDELLVTEIL